MNYEEWAEIYKPMQNPIDKDAAFGGCMVETYGNELDYVRDNDNSNVWTIVDTDNGLVLLAGYHLVNRIGYFITEYPWINASIEINLEED